MGKPSLTEQVAQWFGTGERGLSSEAMAITAIGGKPQCRVTPLDADDLRRCALLVQQAPAIREKFGTIAKLSPKWAVVVKNWDALEASLRVELGDDLTRNAVRGKGTGHTGKMMKALGL